MNVTLYVSGKKLVFTGDFGWYSVSDFVLLGFEFLRFDDYSDGTTIFSLQIAKFIISLTISRVTP